MHAGAPRTHADCFMTLQLIRHSTTHTGLGTRGVQVGCRGSNEASHSSLGLSTICRRSAVANRPWHADPVPSAYAAELTCRLRCPTCSAREGYANQTCARKNPVQCTWLIAELKAQMLAHLSSKLLPSKQLHCTRRQRRQPCVSCNTRGPRAAHQLVKQQSPQES